MFLLTFDVNAQDKTLIDSLNQAYITANHDTEKIYCLFWLGEELIGTNPDTVLIIEEKAMAIAEANLANESSALNNKYKSSLATALNNIGYIYDDQGNIQKALEYYARSLKLREAIGDKEDIANSLNNIGLLYDGQGDIEKAMEYLKESMKLREEIGDKQGLANSLNNIGSMYDDQEDDQKALEYYFKSLKISEEIEDKYEMASSLQHVGSILCELDSVEQALASLKRSLRISKELNDQAWMGTASDLICECYLWINSIDSAEHYAEKAMYLAQEIDYPLNILRAANMLDQVYRKQGKFQQALEMYELEIQMGDSIKNEQNQKAAIRQQTKYEFEKAQLVKEQEEKEKARLLSEKTSRRDNLQYSVILIAILVLFGGVLSLGFVKVSPRAAEGIIFFSFLILFEFLLVLADPYIENWSGGAPGIKLLFNAGIAALIFPAHAFFEARLKGRLVKSNRVNVL